MARRARSLGIPATDIIVEAQSINTAENVVNSCRLIETFIGFESVHSILLVAIHFHMRRGRIVADDIDPKKSSVSDVERVITGMSDAEVESAVGRNGA
jgi:uncharacterized SAM-binding protein YcdF (DUF218 family)